VVASPKPELNFGQHENAIMALMKQAQEENLSNTKIVGMEQ